MGTEKIERLLAAGCENMYPKFVCGAGGDRVVVAEVVGDELIIHAEGEALLATARAKPTPKVKVAAQADTPAEAPTEG